ncbi:MAG: crossover junction endodeoxyribonuclease RuvC [Actinomycetota bacterium]
MFVLGVDPGLSRCGYAVVEALGRGKARPVALGVIRTSPSDAVPVRLAELQTEIVSLLDDYRPVVVAVERIFFQNNVRTAVGVAQASGIVLAQAAGRGTAVVEYSPTAVKSVVAGDGRAEKAQIQTMVQLLLDLPAPPKPADAADAAALALCHLAHDPSLRRTVAGGVAGTIDAAVGRGSDRLGAGR